MTALLFAMVASFVAAIGARDQLLVSRLAGALGAANGLLVVALTSSAVTATTAAWLGSQPAVRSVSLQSPTRAY